MTTKSTLSPTQEQVLKNAAGRQDGSIYPMPNHVKGGATRKVILSLVVRKLVDRNDLITPLGVHCIDPDWLSERAKELEAIDLKAKAAEQAKITAEPDPEEHKPFAYRDGSKQAQAINLMKRTQGATNEQLAELTGWQPHTIRGFISIAKKKGITITTQRLRVVGPNKQGSPGSFTTYFA